jgi:hypothetical protein
MNRRYGWLLGFSLAVVLTLVLAAGLVAAEKPKLMNVQGRVQMLDKDNSSITVEMKAGVRRRVTYTGETKFLYGHSHDNKPGSLDQVKENSYISCSGTYDAKPVLKAMECIYREIK